MLVVGWGGTYGALRQAQQSLLAQGKQVAHAHLRWLSPLEPGLAKIIHNFKHVIVAELNMGQLRAVIRDKFLIDAVGLILWLWDQEDDVLTPVLALGYSNEMVARLPRVARHADNAIGAAFRSAETRIVRGTRGRGRK